MARAPNIATGVGNTNRFRRFKPYRPPPVPTGSYDPALDAQLRASRRGYGDTRQDTALSGTRAAEDFGFGQYAVGEQTGNENTNYNRVVGNENADYTRNVGLLTKNYQNLAASQAERAAQYGVISGGLMLQSAARRGANQASDQAGLDLAHSQTLQGYSDAHTQALQGLQDQLGQLGVGYERGVTDRTTSLARAGRENTAFGLDVQAEKAYQAGQSGYIAPGRGQPGGMPANERIVHGQHVRDVVYNGVRYTYGPDGKIISKKRVK